MRHAKVLVTGATGFIGSQLVERLLPMSGRVRCLVRRTSSLRYLPASEVELVYGDLAGGAGVREAVSGVDAVFHLAGVTKALSPADYYAGNLRASENLARACVGVSRFIHVSSLAAAGPGENVTEEADARPVSHYGRSKLGSERAVRRFLAEAVIVRPPVVYGPRDTDVYRLLRAAARGINLRIGREERWFSIIYVKDLVEGLLAASTSPAAPGRTYFLAHPEAVSWQQFFSVASELMNRKARTVVLPRQAAYAAGWLAELWSVISRKPGILSRDKVTEACCRCWTCDTTRAGQDLAFRAPTSLRRGLKETLAWYKGSGWL